MIGPSPDGLPPILRRVLQAFLPRDRRDEILGDLEEGLSLRARRLGEKRARRWLWKEAASLLLWRTRAPGMIEQPTTGSTNVGTGTTMWGRDLLQDLRIGLRALGRRPGFALTAVAVLGLGIGASTTVFTLVDHIFFERPAGVTEPDRLLRVWRSWASGQGGGSLGNPDYLYYRDNASTLTGLAAYDPGGIVAAYTTGLDRVDQLRAAFVSDNYFDVLGVVPSRGRTFLPEENATPGTHPVAVLSHGFRVRAFGGDPDVVGRTLTLNGTPFTVIGVAPSEFRGLSPVERTPDVWVPIAMRGTLTRARDTAWWERHPDMRSNWLSVVGRLLPGVTFQAAEANLQALSDALEYEGRDEQEGIMVSRQYLYRPSQASALGELSRMLLAVVGLVMAIATANVAVLLLSRATARGREIGIRTAMGASRSRLARHLLAESLVLGAGGGVVGMTLAYLGSDLAAALLPIPFTISFLPDPRVLGVAAALTLLVSALVGLVPAWHAVRSDVARVVHDGAATPSRSRLRQALVVAQVALSLVLVTGAVVFARSFRAARGQDLGFATRDRLVVQVNLRNQGYDEERGLAFISEGMSRIAALPGVLGVTTTRQIPFQGDWSGEFDAPPGVTPNAEGHLVHSGYNAVAPGYFQVAGVPIVRGRALDERDRRGAPDVIVVNETLARALWPGQDPLGKTLPLRDGADFTVVGVARDATYYELGEEPYPQTYFAALQVYQPQIHFLIHTAGSAPDLAPTVQQVLHGIDPTLAFGWVTTMESVFEDQVARYQVSAILVGVISALALVLAATGLSGVVSFLVAQRTREIGVRMALGADRRRVAAQVMGAGLRLAGVGVGLGLVGAWALSGLIRSLLYRVEPTDPVGFAAAAVVLLAAAAAAALGPARRATRVDPVEAMRAE